MDTNALLQLLAVGNGVAGGIRQWNLDARNRALQAAGVQREQGNLDRDYNLNVTKESDLNNFQTGKNQNDAQNNALTYLGKIQTAMAAGQYDLAKVYAGQAVEAGKAFDPATAQAFNTSVSQLIAGGNSALGGSPVGSPSVGGRPASGSAVTGSAPGSAPAAGTMPAPSASGGPASAPSAPTATPPPAGGIGLNIPQFGSGVPGLGSQVMGLLAKPAAPTASAPQQNSPILNLMAGATFGTSPSVAADIAGKNATTTATNLDTTIKGNANDSYANFIKTVGQYSDPAQNADAVRNWDLQHPNAQYKVPGQSYPGAMPAGVMGPAANVVQQPYTLGDIDKAALNKTIQEGNELGARAHQQGSRGDLYGAEAGQVASNDAAKRTLEGAEGSAQTLNAQTAAARAAADTKLNWNRFSLDQQRFIMNDPQAQSQLNRMNLLDRQIAAANAHKATVMTGSTVNDQGMKVPIDPIVQKRLADADDAAIAGYQADKQQAQDTLNARFQARAAMTPANPVTGAGGVALQGPARGALVQPPGLGPLPGLSPIGQGQPVSVKSATSGKIWKYTVSK